jgi:hypothetical protein
MSMAFQKLLTKCSKTKTIIIMLPAFITFMTNYPHHPGKIATMHMLMLPLLWQLQRSKVSKPNYHHHHSEIVILQIKSFGL